MSDFFAFSLMVSSWQKMERIPEGTAIQDTDESSSDRLIAEGRPFLRRLSFFLTLRDWPPARSYFGLFPHPMFQPFLVLSKSRYWLKKHRSDMLVDSGGLFAYLVCVIGLENP
jgi:hypothetical protein